MVSNIEKYHAEVKQKCKQLYAKGGRMPDKMEDQVFSGRYSHTKTLQASFDFIEFLIQQAQIQKLDSGEEMTVTLGIENINKLWILFVKEPNFQSDQALFLNWINKHRSHQVQTYVNY